MENIYIKSKSSSDSTQMIYVVISQTGTVISRILKILTKDPYNHASLSLNKELTQMYSFGRIYARFPLPGGFVNENIHKNVFALHPNTQLLVLAIPVTEEQYNKIEQLVQEIEYHKQEYSYNIVGLILAGIKKPWHVHNKFYCSEFVKYILEEGKIIPKNELPEICKPICFTNIDALKIYEGPMKQYA